MNADAAGLEAFLRGWRRNAEARPVGGDDTRGGGRTREQIAAFEQPCQGLANLVLRKTSPQSPNEFADGPVAISDGGRQRTIELAVEEELAVLRIEADGIGRQQVDGEIRRELRNMFVVQGRAVAVIVRPVIMGPVVGMHVLAFAASTHSRHWKLCSPVCRNVAACTAARGEPTSLDRVV